MMKKDDKSTLRGILIGDSHLRKRTKTAQLTIAHSINQKDYLLYKKSFLERAFNKECSYTEFNSNGYGVCRLYVSHKYLNYCFNWLYCPDKKISLNYLRKISNEGVAFWYMDDGSLYPKKRNGKIHAYELVFSMYVSKEEAEDAIVFMQERFGCNFTIKFNKGKYSIRCGTKEAKKFLNQIQEFIPKCMSYKTFI